MTEREAAQKIDHEWECVPFSDEVRRFVDTTPWRPARTFSRTWPHEYLVKSPQNALMVYNIACHIQEWGIDGQFYAKRQKHHHEGGKMYWTMSQVPEEVTIINRCDQSQTYEARKAAGTLPEQGGH